MKCNVGTTDRVIRIIVGIVIIALGVYFSSWWGLIGIIPLGTGLLRFCPFYRLFGVTTVPKKEE